MKIVFLGDFSRAKDRLGRGKSCAIWRGLWRSSGKVLGRVGRSAWPRAPGAAGRSGLLTLGRHTVILSR
jgi:hypothetical protein